MNNSPEIVKQRRLSNYIPVPESGCWIFEGCWDNRGYGFIKARRGTFVCTAHRYYYLHLVGPIPDGLFVCHKCDTRPCVNPDHLWLGTSKENTIDMCRKGRNRPRGKVPRFSKHIQEAA